MLKALIREFIQYGVEVIFKKEVPTTERRACASCGRHFSALIGEKRCSDCADRKKSKSVTPAEELLWAEGHFYDWRDVCTHCGCSKSSIVAFKRKCKK